LFNGERPAALWQSGKAMGLLLTGAGEEADNADLVIRGFQQLAAWVQAHVASHWFVGGCTEREAIGQDVKGRAAEFARTLADNTV